jgi:hypothetical protein
MLTARSPVQSPVFFRPSSDMSIYVLKPGTTEIQPIGVPGELCYGSTNLTCGYIGRPDDNAIAYIANPYHSDFGHARLWRSGDLAVVPEPGHVALLGRLSQQIKIDGVRADPVEIQNAILHHPQVKVVRVLCIDTPSSKGVLTGCVIHHGTALSQDHHNLFSDIRTTCEGYLPRSMIPSIWQSYDSFPTTGTGKVDMQALADVARRRACEESGPDPSPGSRHDSVASVEGIANDPTGDYSSEATLLDVVLPILFGTAKRGANYDEKDFVLRHSFIQCGGTSLGAMKAIAQLRKSGSELALSDFLSSDPLMVVARRLKRSAVKSDTHVRSNESVFSIDARSALSGAPHLITIRPGDVEAIFPCTSFQSLSFSLSLVSTKQYTVYSYLDFAAYAYTAENIANALQLLTEKKPVLRTVMIPSDNDWSSDTNDFKRQHGVKYQGFLQAVLRAARFEFSEHYDASNPTDHFIRDTEKQWAIGEPLWRASYMERSGILAINMHHALTDFWTSELLNRDLFALLKLMTAPAESSLPLGLNDLLQKVSRPDMRHLMVTANRTSPPASAGDKQLGGREPAEKTAQHSNFWKRYLEDAKPSFVADSSPVSSSWRQQMQQPHQTATLPTTYRSLCTKNDITSGAFWHAIWSLTLANSLDNDRDEVTYYRCASNRESQAAGFEIEGALCSNTPIRVNLNKADTVVQLARKILVDCTRTRPAQPWFVDDFADGGPLGTQRAYGNTIFNHVVFEDCGIQEEPNKFDNLIPGYSYFS